MEWTKKESLKLIEMWQNFSCLWDTKSDDYRNRDMKRDAIKAMADQIGVGGPAVERKLLSLRTQFNRELTKLRAKAAEGEEAHSNWYAFECMQFLKDKNPPRTFTSSIQFYKQEHPLSPEENSSSTSYSEPRSFSQQSTCSTIKRRRKRKSFEVSINNPEACKPTLNHKKDEEDEFSLFGEAMANELKGIKSERRLILAKKEIMTMIFNAKLAELDSVYEEMGTCE